jgi:D-amino peptidase
VLFRSGGINYLELHPEAKWIAGNGIFHVLNYTGFDAVIFVGQHARNGVPRAHLNHTMDSRMIVEVKINNVAVGEFGLWAGFFGQMNVPIIFLSGDQAACEEARTLIPEMVAVAVKEGLEREVAVHLSPQKVHALIYAGVQSALQHRSQITPLRFTSPFQMTVEYPDTAQAQRQALNKMGQLIHPRIVAVESEDYFKLIHYWL